MTEIKNSIDPFNSRSNIAKERSGDEAKRKYPD